MRQNRGFLRVPRTNTGGKPRLLSKQKSEITEETKLDSKELLLQKAEDVFKDAVLDLACVITTSLLEKIKVIIDNDDYNDKEKVHAIRTAILEIELKLGEK